MSFTFQNFINQEIERISKEKLSKYEIIQRIVNKDIKSPTFSTCLPAYSTPSESEYGSSSTNSTLSSSVLEEQKPEILIDLTKLFDLDRKRSTMNPFLKNLKISDVTRL